MEAISGLTNWRLTVRRDPDGVTVLRALTCDERAVLPDELLGLPVTALQDHALAAPASPAAGEELRVFGGAESGDWDNRNIRELTLPRHLKSIGNYAFMNLRSMEKLLFFDDLRETGSESFMNCRSFSRLELTRTGLRQGPALALLVQNLRQELDVTIHESDGSLLTLVFPEYLENYTVNSAAHHFELSILGGGYPYHGVFRDRTLSVADYDALWNAYIAREHDEESALRLAYSRLRCPVQLGAAARERYAAYIRRNIRRAFSHALREKDLQGLRMLTELGGFETEALDAALEEARTLRFTEATALFLERRHAHSAAGRSRKYEL